MGEENKLDDLGASIAEIERLLGMRDAADADPVKENKKYGQTYVRVSKDLHEAWLYLARPKEGEYYTKESFGDSFTVLITINELPELYNTLSRYDAELITGDDVEYGSYLDAIGPGRSILERLKDHDG